MKVHSIDIVCIVVYFVFVLGLGLYFARKKEGAEDLFLAGRKLGWAIVGFSLFASNISSTTLVGLMGSAYSTGISISAYEWGAALVLVFFALFVIPFFLNSRVYTIPEYFERRFHPIARPYFASVTIFGNVFIETAGTLYAGALVIQLFFPQIELWQSGIVLAAVAGLYTAAGGLEAVVYTDAVQAVILIIGAIAMTYLAVDAVGGWQVMISKTPDKMLSMVHPNDDPVMPWLGMALGAPILSIYYWCTNQYVVQRVLGARNVDHARRGALFAAMMKLTILFIMVFPGVAARLLYPELDNPDTVFPTLIAKLLPVGLKGIVLAGFIAAIMSSIDSTLNSASTLVTMDFVRRYKPDASDQTLGRIGQLVTVIFMVVAAAWVPVVAQFENLFVYLQGSFAYIFPQVAGVFVLGLFWTRMNGKGALAGMIGGHLIALVLFITDILFSFPGVHFLHLAVLFFALSIALAYLVSIATEPPPKECVEGYTWNPALLRVKPPAIEGGLIKRFFLDYRLQSVFVVGAVAVMLIIYW